MSSGGLLDQVRDTFEGKIPFQGQRLADRLNQEIIVLGAVSVGLQLSTTAVYDGTYSLWILCQIVAWLVGYFTDSLFLAMCLFGAAFVAAFVLCVPSWPMYHKHPVIWLPNLPSDSKLDEISKIK